MGPHPEYAVDLEKVVRERTGGRRVPRFVLRALNRFLRLDYINEFLSQGYEGVEFCTKCMEYMGVTLIAEGLERVQVPEGSKITFASNHPLGGVDGVALTGIVGTRFGEDIGLIVNDFLMYLKGLSPFFVPVSKLGGQSREMPALVRGLFASRQNVIVFPAGSCSRKIDGVIQDKPWSKAFVRFSRENGRYIVPVHFIGRNSKRFYRVDAICKKLGIKFNFAMFFLPSELYRARGKTFRIVFGNPIPADGLDAGMGAAEISSMIREQVYKLN
ncbi:MAG: glycerol acyltransferase [Bacteroidales bacterium]|nr:glycerol acyltransferase [Bacteroidales bacterium]